MNSTTIQSALEVLQNPDKVRLLLTEPMDNTGQVPPFSLNLTTEKAAELVIAIAENTGNENEKFSTIYDAVKHRNEMANRDIPIQFDYLIEAYEFLRDNWAVLYFIIAMLNKKGYFKDLKKDKDLKTFFEVFFDEKIEIEKKDEVEATK